MEKIIKSACKRWYFYDNDDTQILFKKILGGKWPLMGGKLGGFGGPPRYGVYIGGNGGPLKWGVVWELWNFGEIP